MDVHVELQKIFDRRRMEGSETPEQREKREAYFHLNKTLNELSALCTNFTAMTRTRFPDVNYD